ncbi:hypothetical protein B6V00_01185 [ANME-1 cluster archaeon ex4572_4]|nr:MAG: hypothetical protein B6V00_01185 [ANME-1 cluster archaeon ex4572_4]PXF51298.1 MAG: hypothetical protein C4B55_02560 [Methanophagales archaeon]
MPEEKKKKSWIEIEAEKADKEEGGRKAQIIENAKCENCGKEVEEGEYIVVRGRVLCAECYEGELEEGMDMGAADVAGAG